MVKSPVVTIDVITPTPTPPSGVSLKLSALSGGYPSSVVATVTLTNPSTGQPISGATVNLYITNGDNGPVTLTTDSSGTATYTFTTPAEGLYLFLAEYNGKFSEPATYLAGFDTMTPPQPLSTVLVKSLGYYDQGFGNVQMTLKDSSGNVAFSWNGSFSGIPQSGYYYGKTAPIGGFPSGQYYFSISGTAPYKGQYIPFYPYSDIPITLTEGKPTTIVVVSEWNSPASTGTTTIHFYPEALSLPFSVFKDAKMTLTSLANGETQSITPSTTENVVEVTIPQGVYVVHFNATDPYWFDVYIINNTCAPGSTYPCQQDVPTYHAWHFIPMSNPFAWGSASPSGEYLFTTHWTNPAILARVNLPSPNDNLSITEVQTALPYSQITLSPTPSWGYNRIVYGDDGYIYTLGLHSAGGFPVVLYKYDPNDISTPVWSTDVSLPGDEFLYGLIAFGGYVYVSDTSGNIAKYDASTGELVASASGVGDTSATSIFSYNELHTDGKRLWRHPQSSYIYEVDPTTLKVLNQNTQKYTVATYDVYTDTFFGAWFGNCASGQTSGCYSSIVDMIDPNTYKVLAEWQNPYLRAGGGSLFPTAIAADQDYVFVGFYFYPGASSPPPMLNTGLPEFYTDKTFVHVLNITPPSSGSPSLTYKGSLYIGVSPGSTAGSSGEKIRRIIALGDGYVYIENDDANAVIFRYRESDWSLQGLILHPQWYINIVNSGTPAQPRPDGWEEIRDFAINKWVPS